VNEILAALALRIAKMELEANRRDAENTRLQARISELERPQAGE
jgi:hypothetical protein